MEVDEVAEGVSEMTLREPFSVETLIDAIKRDDCAAAEKLAPGLGDGFIFVDGMPRPMGLVDFCAYSGATDCWRMFCADQANSDAAPLSYIGTKKTDFMASVMEKMDPTHCHAFVNRSMMPDDTDDPCSDREWPRPSTALCLAAGSNDIQSVRALIALGASKTQLDHLGFPPMYYTLCQNKDSDDVLAAVADAELVRTWRGLPDPARYGMRHDMRSVAIAHGRQGSILPYIAPAATSALIKMEPDTLV